MKIENIVISSDEQKVYYVNYVNKIMEELKIKKDIKNYSRAYKFFMSTNKS